MSKKRTCPTPPTFIDLKGMRYGKWLVIERDTTKAKNTRSDPSFWLCRCDCDNWGIVRSYSLRNGGSRQCKRCQWDNNGRRLR
jgi:hypothetical protein